MEDSFPGTLLHRPLKENKGRVTYLDHGELQEDAPAGPQHVRFAVGVRLLRVSLSLRATILLQQLPCSRMDAPVLPC